MRNLSQINHPIYIDEITPSFITRYFEYSWASEQFNNEDIILDIGCNTGMGLDILSKHVKTVWGTDVIPDVINSLNEKYKNNNKIKVKLVPEDNEICFSDNYFDGIVACNLIEHINSPDIFLEKLKKCLKPKGRIIFSTVNRKLRLYWWQKPYNPFHYNEFSHNSLRKTLLRHFNKVEIFGVFTSPPFFPDYIKLSSTKKFDNGIRYPLYHFYYKNIRRLIRPITSIRKKKYIINETNNSGIEKKYTINEALSFINIKNTDLDKCSEILAIAYK